MKYFQLHEFDSPDSPGSGSMMQLSTLMKLEVARGLAGIPFVINSGYRTKAHNYKVGGVSDSAHERGFAVDIAANSPVKRWKILESCIKAGFRRIGIGKDFIHVDDDPSKPAGVVWLY